MSDSNSPTGNQVKLQPGQLGYKPVKVTPRKRAKHGLETVQKLERRRKYVWNFDAMKRA